VRSAAVERQLLAEPAPLFRRLLLAALAVPLAEPAARA